MQQTKRISSLLFICTILTVSPVLAQVHEFNLDNGLKILVKEDHRAPVVVSQIWYKVGSGYEHDGITGVSHVLEHMMFKGTEKHGPGEFSRIIAENGGKENAFTGRDYTAYFQQLEKSRMEVSFEMEADRMRNLLLPKEEFAKEVKVVMEERRMRTEDNPQALTYEQMNAAAYTNSPYHHPIIGWMQDLESLETADLATWYQRWYAPNNATLVVVGDIDPQQVHKLAKKHFGSLKPSNLKQPKPRTESKQRGIRRVTVRAPAKLPYLLMGYKVPVLKTAAVEWEPYALEVLAGILDGGNSARLSKNLVRKQQLAASAGAGYNLYSMRQILFLLDGTPAQGHTTTELEKAIRSEIEQLKTEPVNEQELARIKAQVIAGKIYEQDSPFYQAMQIGTLETVGLGWQRVDEYSDKVLAITASQVQEVARKYLIDDRLTIGKLDPLPLDNNTNSNKQGDKQNVAH